MMKMKLPAAAILLLVAAQPLLSDSALRLETRRGKIPRVRGPIPHQQLTQNSSEKVYRKLLRWALKLPHVSLVDSRNSFPSARGLFIARSIRVDYRVDREFAHIHRVPGPGSMHLKMLTEDIEYIKRKRWGRYHPISSDVAGQKGKVAIVMIYAPRNERDLTQIKKILRRAYDFAVKGR